MRIFIAIAAILIVAAIEGAPSAAQADPYRWCAQYSGRGATNCGFVTLEQCQWALSGNGGFCVPNTFYDGRPVTTPGESGRRARAR